MTGQPRRFYRISQSTLLRPLLSSVVTALGIHWLFQCLLEMDRTERWFKIGTDLLLTVILALLLHRWLPSGGALGLAWLVAHTLNLLFNGQVMVVLKHFGVIRHSAPAFNEYVRGFQSRLRGAACLRWAAAYGSLSRGEWQPTSDLDVRVIRKPGMVNGLRACLFVMCERSRAFWQHFPLDILLLDSPRLLARLSVCEAPVVLYDALAGTRAVRLDGPMSDDII